MSYRWRAFCAPTVWNSLPWRALRDNSLSLNMFERQLTTACLSLLTVMNTVKGQTASNRSQNSGEKNSSVMSWCLKVFAAVLSADIRVLTFHRRQVVLIPGSQEGAEVWRHGRDGSTSIWPSGSCDLIWRRSISSMWCFKCRLNCLRAVTLSANRLVVGLLPFWTANVSCQYCSTVDILQQVATYLAVWHRHYHYYHHHFRLLTSWENAIWSRRNYVKQHNRGRPQAWAGGGGHLPPNGNVVKCFLCISNYSRMFSRWFIYALFLQPVVLFWGLAPRPPPGLRPWTPLGDFRPEIPNLPTPGKNPANSHKQNQNKRQHS